MIALQKPVRPATGENLRGLLFFYIRGVCHKTNGLSLYKSFTEEIWKCSVVGTYECFNVWKHIENVYAASTGYTNQSQQELSVC